MKIQCGVCEKAAATVICCADEAALCDACDVQVHAANKLASKHQRILLDCLSTKLPRCDICQEKRAFIFCVEDRALFCTACDKAIHVPGTLSGDHQRLLATGIHVALAPPPSTAKVIAEGPTEPPAQPSFKSRQLETPVAQAYLPSTWAIEDLLQLSDCESGDKQKYSVGYGELEWLADIDLFPDPVPEAALRMAEVPQLPIPAPYDTAFCTSSKLMPPSQKKPRIVIDDIEELFKVPDLG